VSTVITYTALFGFILATQLGRRTLTLDKLILPVLIVCGMGFSTCRTCTPGPPARLACRAVTTAGWPYAAVWAVALAARMLFAYGSTHWFRSALIHLSITNHINPTTYGPFFMLMVLTMISIRTLSVIAAA
jgi:hypothetical protein